MVYSCDRAVRALKDPGSMKPPMNEPDFEDLVTDHHSYAASVAGYRRRLSGPGAFDAGTVSGFIDTMGISGLSPGRQVFYVTRLPRILPAIRATGARSVAALDADGCKAVLAVLVSEKYSGETKLAYALCLKKLVHYAKTGNLGGRGAAGGYVDEVSWITPSQYRSKSGGVRRQDLLTGDEFVRMVRAATSVRDRALLWVMYEGAFRPGEMLNMRVGGVEFADRYMMVSTEGKTGQKDLALVLSLSPMLAWMRMHPHADNPRAPLWYSAMSPGRMLSYATLTGIVRKASARAGLRKRVWPYLLRHTQLTNMSTKLPDPLLRVYGNWTQNSRMSARYTHLSAADARSAILRMHDIGDDGGDDIAGHLRLLRCPRCESDCTPDLELCPRCGLMLSEGARAKVGTSDIVRSRMRDKLLRSRALEQEVDSYFERMLESGLQPGGFGAGGQQGADPGRG